MGWGVIIKEVYVNRASVDTLEHEIEELNDLIAIQETEIAMLVGATPNTLNNDGDALAGAAQWIDVVPNRLQNLLYEYKKNVRRLHLLELARDNGVEENY